MPLIADPTEPAIFTMWLNTPTMSSSSCLNDPSGPEMAPHAVEMADDTIGQTTCTPAFRSLKFLTRSSRTALTMNPRIGPTTPHAVDTTDLTTFHTSSATLLNVEKWVITRSIARPSGPSTTTSKI